MSAHDVEDIYELSPMQQGMLFHTLYAPEAGMYFEQFSYTLKAQLNIAAFQRSWQILLERHASLRTSFFWEDLDKPLQVVHSSLTLPFVQLDWREMTEDEQKSQLETFLLEERTKGFDLEVAPLIKTTLIRKGPDTYEFIWSNHHLLMDGWSMSLLLQEFMVCYAALCEQAEMLLQPSYPFRNYISWLQQQDLGRAEAFWRKMLRGFTTPTPLTVEKAASEVVNPGLSYDQHGLRLSPTTTAALQVLARQCQVTLNTIVQGAWALLLSRYSGAQEVMFGATVSGRPADLPGAEDTIGLFINTLPVRVSAPAHQPLLEWLKEIQALNVELREYEYSPLIQVRNWSDLPRSTGLFESIIVFENYPQETVLAEWKGQIEVLDARTFARTNYALTLGCFPSSELVFQLIYDQARFESDTIIRMLGHLETLLTAMLANPACPLGRLALLSAAERDELLVLRNQTALPLPALSYPALVLAQAARTPDAVAVLFDRPQPGVWGLGSGVSQTSRQADKQTSSQESGVRSQESEFLAPNRQSPTRLPPPAGAGTEAARSWASMTLSPQSSVLSPEQLTYAELATRATQLAHLLHDYGVGPLVPVALCCERSLELPLLLLAIGLAGGAFLPLDPQLPPARLAFLLHDARAPLLLTQRALLPLLPASCAHLLPIEQLLAALPSAPASPLPPPDVALLAYIIYTSGSTGSPKGVMVSHHNLVNYLGWCATAYAAADGRGAPVQSSIAADAIFPSLFAPLLVGSTVHILPEADALTALAHALPRQAPFSLLKITPTQLEVLTTLLANTPIGGREWVRTLVVGAEAVHAEGLSPWRAAASVPRILNEYGPTETTVGCSLYQLPSHFAPAGAVPFGQPSANTQFYVLDRALEPVPIGVVGELYIGGQSLAWGYLNRPDLTAERFVPNPFTDFGFWILDFGLGATVDPIQNPKSKIQNGTRLYRTGDLVRYLADREANLLFVGRVDEQIKLRGYRVEPAEVAAVLAELEGVAESVVLARADGSAGLRLVAYVVPQPGATLEVAALREHAQARLPHYMVPSAFVELERLPLTATGKLDRQALPAPNQQRAEDDDTYVAPRTPLEELLANLWASVLNVDKVGIRDHFFEIGGHSLLATQIVSRIRKTFQVNLPLRSLFDMMTVEQLAQGLIAYETQPGQVEKIARLRKQLASMSAEEVQQALQQKRRE